MKVVYRLQMLQVSCSFRVRYRVIFSDFAFVWHIFEIKFYNSRKPAAVGPEQLTKVSHISIEIATSTALIGLFSIALEMSYGCGNVVQLTFMFISDLLWLLVSNVCVQQVNSNGAGRGELVVDARAPSGRNVKCPVSEHNGNYSAKFQPDEVGKFCLGRLLLNSFCLEYFYIPITRSIGWHVRSCAATWHDQCWPFSHERKDKCQVVGCPLWEVSVVRVDLQVRLE